MSSKGKGKAQSKSATKKTTTKKSAPRKTTTRLPLEERVLKSVADKDLFIEKKIQELTANSSMSHDEADRIAREDFKQILASELIERSKFSDKLATKINKKLSEKINSLDLTLTKKAYENLQSGVSPDFQVSKSMVMAFEPNTMAGTGGPVLDPSMMYEPQQLGQPPMNVGDEDTRTSGGQFLKRHTYETTQTEIGDTQTNVSNTSAISNIKTSQGGGGQHAVMPLNSSHAAEMGGVFSNPGVNMISQALNRTVGGGGGPPAFMDSGAGGSSGDVPPLPTPYKVPKPAKKRTKGFDLIGNAMNRMLEPSIHSVISSQQPNVYRSEKVRDPSVVGQVPKRMEILDDALFKQPRDPCNATEYGWFKMNDSYCEPAKLGTISAFEKYNADPGIVNLTGMLGPVNGISMDDRWVNNLNPVMFQDKSVQPCGWVDYSKNFLTGFGIG